MTLSVLVPSSLVREAEDKREATRKLGYVARAAAVFRADRLVVFPDEDGERKWGGGFVETVLRYAATPPYLRKEAFDTRDELEYVGVLPPLRLSSWTGSDSSGSGSIRQGIVTQVGSEGRVRVNCGMQHPISLHEPPGMELSEGERVTIRVSSRRPVRAKIVDEPLPGFTVERTALGDALDRSDAGVRIATSRHGTPLSAASLEGYVERIARDGLTVAFGAPGRGLPPMLGLAPDEVGSERASGEGRSPSDRSSGLRGGEAASNGTGAEPSPGPREDGDEPRAADDEVSEAVADPNSDAPARFDAWLNTIPSQGSEVVRTEEALFASLGCLTLTE